MQTLNIVLHGQRVMRLVIHVVGKTDGSVGRQTDRQT